MPRKFVGDDTFSRLMHLLQQEKWRHKKEEMQELATEIIEEALKPEGKLIEFPKTWQRWERQRQKRLKKEGKL